MKTSDYIMLFAFCIFMNLMSIFFYAIQNEAKGTIYSIVLISIFVASMQTLGITGRFK